MKKLIILLIAVLLAGAAGISAQRAGDLTVLAAYNKQTKDSEDKWGTVNAGASYTMKLHRSIYFMPDVRLGLQGPAYSDQTCKFDGSVRADFAVKGDWSPIYLFTGPVLDILAYRQKYYPLYAAVPFPDGSLPEISYNGPKYTKRNHTLAKFSWHVGLSFDFNPVSLKAAYGFFFTDDKYERTQYIEIALGWNFKL